ncbi:MAG: hypothetical protein VYC34_12040, partial [Planctomycetota bacterium]|nr:hypothetical protein [Planctomycetota bacterium]
VAGAPSTTAFAGTLSAGTTVSITPQISEGGFLVLQFSLELSSFDARVNPDLPPPQNSNTVESVITVPSDSTVVVGGFKSRNEQDSVQKIPILGDIPLLGLLFREYTTDYSESTIFFFITPRVLSDPYFADLRLLSEGPMREVEIESITPNLRPEVVLITGALPANAPSYLMPSDEADDDEEPINPEDDAELSAKDVDADES